MKRVTVNISDKQDAVRKKLKADKGISLQTIDEVSYEMGLESLNERLENFDLFEAMADAFRPPKI
jgi:hypothetical protein